MQELILFVTYNLLREDVFLMVLLETLSRRNPSTKFAEILKFNCFALSLLTLLFVTVGNG